MNWLAEQFELLGDFLRSDFRRSLLFCTLGLFAAVILGVVIAGMAPELVVTVMENFMDQVQEAGVIDETGSMSVFALLTNNWMAMVFSTLYGFIPFLFLPLFSLFVNGSLLGMLAAIYRANGIPLATFLAGILPHGIFELPALVFSITCGLCLCRNMCRLVTGSSKRVPMVEILSDLLRVLLLIVLPLTAMAAVVECYITPMVMEFFM